MKPDKNIEELAKYVIEKAELETPSADFVNKVMHTINSERNVVPTIITYKPLISKPVWGVLAVALVVLTTFIFKGTVEEITILSNIDLYLFDKLKLINVFENIKFSKIFTYSFILFLVFVLVQIVVIKNYKNKQFSI